ncbi:MAG: hypothetical protein LBC67_03370 [Spirochaetales bacterium]|jgi:ribonucleoside-triphosphate reductase|nr:hypothetical protein [Spirochaetales bacterium]
MRSIEAITEEIAEVRTRLENIRGTETEVYTRIVGYYRSLRNWNKGKREEYTQRLPFDTLGSLAAKRAGKEESGAACGEALGDIAGYRYFYRKACPNCPPVRDFVSRLPLAGDRIDVDTEDGLSEALAHDIQSTPTVVFFDRQGRARHRSHSVRQLEDLFANAV